VERALGRGGCLRGLLGIREGAEKLVRAAVDFDPARFFDGSSEKIAVICEQPAVAVAQRLNQRGRPLDVSE